MTEPPTPEDFEAHYRVEAWERQQRHQLAIYRGLYELHISSEGVWIETDYEREPLTDELAATIGITITKQGEMTWHQRTL